ncbi:MAG: insulinase family protein [Elusimicrobia bacterium]|nr:insulinase family protein [Elusimicrobiota bacterium]
MRSLLIRLTIALFALMPSLTVPPLSHAEAVQRLPNGLRYVIIEDHTAPIVSLQIWVRCGGVNEDDKTSGVSHFLEHMLFKGTERLTAGEIAQVVESNGGSINAATGMEMTHYYIDMPSESFELAFDVLADSVLNPSFPPGEYEKERRVILEEIKRRNDQPQSNLWDALLEVVYRKTPYRRPVIGSVDSITRMTRDVLVNQHKAYYVPSNMVVVAAGDFKTSFVRKKISGAFGKLPKNPIPAQPLLVEPLAEEPIVKRITRPAQQAHVALGFLGPTLDHPDQVAMDALSTVLGGGQSSRLYQVLREQKKIVWSVGASFMSHAGSGLFGLFAECPPEQARSLPNEFYLLLTDAEMHGFSKDELDRAKAQLRSSWLFSQETYHGKASQWGFYTTLGRPELLRTYLKKLDKVTLDDLTRLLHTYFRGRELSGAVLLPTSYDENK